MSWRGGATLSKVELAGVDIGERFHGFFLAFNGAGNVMAVLHECDGGFQATGRVRIYLDDLTFGSKDEKIVIRTPVCKTLKEAKKYFSSLRDLHLENVPSGRITKFEFFDPPIDGPALAALMRDIDGMHIAEANPN